MKEFPPDTAFFVDGPAYSSYLVYILMLRSSQVSAVLLFHPGILPDTGNHLLIFAVCRLTPQLNILLVESPPPDAGECRPPSLPRLPCPFIRCGGLLATSGVVHSGPVEGIWQEHVASQMALLCVSAFKISGQLIPGVAAQICLLDNIFTTTLVVFSPHSSFLPPHSSKLTTWCVFRDASRNSGTSRDRLVLSADLSVLAN